MGIWLIWLGVGGIVAWAVAYAVRKWRREHVGYAPDENASELEREGQLALLVRERSRYARSYAKDMLDKGLSKADREHFRQKYEQAKTNSLIELLTINDEFYRGIAAHGVIDLLLAGGEIEAAKRLFETLEESLQDLTASTKRGEYASLYRS